MRYTKLIAFLILPLLGVAASARALPRQPRPVVDPPVLLLRASHALDPAEQPDEWSHAPALSADGPTRIMRI